MQNPPLQKTPVDIRISDEPVAPQVPGRDRTLPSGYRNNHSVTVDVHPAPLMSADQPAVSNSSIVTTDSGSLSFSDSLKMSQSALREEQKLEEEEETDEMDQCLAVIEKQLQTQNQKYSL